MSAHMYYLPWHHKALIYCRLRCSHYLHGSNTTGQQCAVHCENLTSHLSSSLNKSSRAGNHVSHPCRGRKRTMSECCKLHTQLILHGLKQPCPHESRNRDTEAHDPTWSKELVYFSEPRFAPREPDGPARFLPLQWLYLQTERWNPNKTRLLPPLATPELLNMWSHS